MMPSGDGKGARKKDAPGDGQQRVDGNRPRRDRPFSEYAQALAFLAARPNVETTRPESLSAASFDLSRMRALMTALGDPQNDVRCVHVAGSKGKGSVCEMVASCLEACGYTVGLYTSPHLVDLRERIRLKSGMISQDAFATVLSRVASAAEELPETAGEASHFELMTAAALLYFAEMAVDIAVIEVGMGGRLDATNVVRPVVTAIAEIQLEHTRVLGDTLEKIAAEKAGILKKGVPCVSVPQKPEVMGVLRAVASEVGATVEELGKEIEFSCRVGSSPELGPHAKVVLTTPRSTFEHLPVPLRGEHQAVNCGLALAILDRLRTMDFVTPEALVAQGLARTPSNGRLELVNERPRVYIDGAHNPESIQALIRSVGAQVRSDSLVVVFGCAADKDVPRMLAALASGADKVIFTRASDNPRAADPRDLQKRFAEVSAKMTQVAPNVREALSLAARAVQRDDLIIVTGSFSVAGEAKRLLAERDAARRSEAASIREVKPSGVSVEQPRRRPGRVS